MLYVKIGCIYTLQIIAYKGAGAGLDE